MQALFPGMHECETQSRQKARLGFTFNAWKESLSFGYCKAIYAAIWRACQIVLL